MNKTRANTGRVAGFTIVELLVAMALGMLLTVAMGFVYLTSKTAFSRQQQLSSIQQSVRSAFDFLSNDARMVGHFGCYTGSALAAPTFNSDLGTTTIANNFVDGVEGYEAKNTTAGKLTMSSSNPADETDTSKWETNVASGIATIPLSTIAGTGNGLTPGSDVLVIRTVSGRPIRLAATANIGANQSTLSIETSSGGTSLCPNGSTAKVSGFCAPSGSYTGSYGLIANCSRARLFSVSSVAAGTAPSPSTLTLGASMGSDPQYTTDATEIFPVQTIVYYVRRSSSGTTTSLYRRIFDGTQSAGLEQELIEGVESMQVTYGVDTTATPDGVVDTYVAAKGPTGLSADSVTDWSRVVAVRVGLLARSTARIDPDMAAALPASAPVNDVDVTYPTAGTKYDRRVFTTTIAVRNKITFF